MSELLSLPRMARRLGVTQQWLREEAEAGKIPCLKAGNRYLFNSDAVQGALAVEAAKTLQGGCVDDESSPLHDLQVVLSECDQRLPRLALRPKEAALALGISERLLWSKTNCGEVPHCRINTAIVYPVHLLKEWLTAQSEGGAK